MNLTRAIRCFKDAMNHEGLNPEEGLGTEVFCFASTLMPVINVDLLTINDKKEILLSWRNDPHCGTGWHVPGGCIRFMERIEKRIQETAKTEIGTNVASTRDPIRIFEILSREQRQGIEDQRERAHFITLVYLCKVPEDYIIPSEKNEQGQAGALKWFTDLPENLIPIQECYRTNWDNIKKVILED